MGKAEWIILPPQKPTFTLTKLYSESSGTGRIPVFWAFTKQPNNKFEKYYSQLDELKITTEQNHSEMGN